MPALEHDRLLAGAREICRGDEPVVATTDDDGVVPVRFVHQARFLGGSKKGSFRTHAFTRLRRCSIVISSSSSVPGLPSDECTWPSARYCFRMGDQVPLVAYPTCFPPRRLGAHERQAKMGTCR